MQLVGPRDVGSAPEDALHGDGKNSLPPLYHLAEEAECVWGGSVYVLPTGGL